MVDVEESLDALTQFNARVKLILGFGMTQKLLAGGSLNYELVATNDEFGEYGMAFVGGSAEIEGTHALANVVRLFLQKKEALGIRHLMTIYESGVVSPALTEEFRSARNELNDYLDQASSLEIPGGTKRTKREYFELHLFGDISHTTQRKQYAQIAWHPVLRALSRMEFDRAVRCLLRTLITMKDINERALSELS